MAGEKGLCLNRTNGKDNHVRLRTSSRSVKTVQNLTLTLILTLTINLNPNPNPNPNTKKRNLKKRKPSGFELPNSSACDNPTKRAKWQFVTNHLICLPFIAHHVIDKKLVLNLSRLSFPLVRFRPAHFGYEYVETTIRN